MTLDELISLGLSAGRYRLEAVDGDGRLIPGTVAFTEISEEAIEEAKREDGDDPETERIKSSEPTSREMVDLVKNQTHALVETVRSLTAAFGPVHPRFAEQPVYLPAPMEKDDSKAEANTQLAQLGQIIDQSVKAWAMFQASKTGGAAAGGTPCTRGWSRRCFARSRRRRTTRASARWRS